MKTRAEELIPIVSTLGLRRALPFCLQWLRLRLARDERVIALSTPDAQYPLGCRANTSDFEVFYQIFIDREYSCFDDLEDVKLVVDCGAYVGYSSAYFLSRFPHAEVVAIEPDDRNFELLTQNLRPYGGRARPVRSAVWSHSVDLVNAESKFRDGREWARQFRVPESGKAGTVPAVDIGTVLHESGNEQISILKVDIEGAEAVILSRGYESWLPKVENIAIELHEASMWGDGAAAFQQSMVGNRFTTSRSGELTVCRRAQDRLQSQ